VSRPQGSPQVIPYLYYPDATKAFDFLQEAFGFETKSVLRGSEDEVWTAQLRAGDGVVMIGPGMDEFGTRAVGDPDSATMRTFVYVDDLQSHCERARAAGATIRTEPTVHGDNKIYVASDCGGQQWIFAEPV
jgi:uncharacterized glyoxalase superfamily protein PhnB